MPPTDTKRRETALEPYRTALIDAHAAQPTAPVTLPVETSALTLEPWESDVLRRHPEGTDEDGHPWPTLVLEGLAFRAKCLARTCRRDADEASTDSIETAAGVAILEDLHEIVEEFLRAGRMKEVKPLTDLRNHVRQDVTEMRKLLRGVSEDELEDAVASFRGEHTLSPLDSQDDRPSESGSRRAPVQFKKDPAPTRVVYRTDRPDKGKLGPLLGVFVLCAVVWAGINHLQRDAAPPPELTLEAFSHLAAVRSVEARPPSLYVRVDVRAWEERSSADRLELLREIGTVAGRAGYVGVQLWTDDGVPAGSWYPSKGAQLVDRSAGPS